MAEELADITHGIKEKTIEKPQFTQDRTSHNDFVALNMHGTSKDLLLIRLTFTTTTAILEF